MRRAIRCAHRNVQAGRAQASRRAARCSAAWYVSGRQTLTPGRRRIRGGITTETASAARTRTWKRAGEATEPHDRRRNHDRHERRDVVEHRQVAVDHSAMRLTQFVGERRREATESGAQRRSRSEQPRGRSGRRYPCAAWRIARVRGQLSQDRPGELPTALEAFVVATRLPKRWNVAAIQIAVQPS
jgi:hypothetical protein